MIATGPGAGLTKATGRPLPAAAAVLLFQSGAIAISSRSSIWVSAAGDLAALASSSLSLVQPGSRSPSDPPNVLAAIARVARPRLEDVRAIPTCPRYSGFHRSAQLAGGVFTRSVL